MVEEVIRAKRFEVIDDAGRPRVIVGTQEEASGLMLWTATVRTSPSLR